MEQKTRFDSNWSVKGTLDMVTCCDIMLVIEKCGSNVNIKSAEKLNNRIQNIGLGIRIALVIQDLEFLNSLLYGFDVREEKVHFLALADDNIVADIVLLYNDLALCDIREKEVA